MNKKCKIVSFLLTFIIFLQFFGGFSAKTARAKVIEECYESMITIEKKTGRILFEKDKDKKLPMASTTKILTALVAIENTEDLHQKHKIPKEAIGVEGSSIYLKENEELSLKELLYGLMLRSGNDAAVAIAIIIAGSVENFVKLMNAYCIKLNLKNTHIVTVNGLHDAEHYTSASDLAKITSMAMGNEVFKEIVETKEIVINSTLDNKNKCRLLKNKNKLLKMVDGATGVKTGYTTKAGKCFVGSASRNGLEVICVVLNARSMFDECAALIEKSFAEFRRIKLFSKGEILSKESAEKGGLKSSIILKDDIYYVLTRDELLRLKAKINLNENNKHAEGLIDIGTIDFVIENNLIFSEKIYTIKGKKISSLKENFNKIIRSF